MVAKIRGETVNKCVIVQRWWLCILLLLGLLIAEAGVR